VILAIKKAIESPNCAIGAVFRRFYAQQTGDPMATDCIAQLTFKCYPKTKTVARFDPAQASTDGGVV
jgi:hypothetical protein